MLTKRSIAPSLKTNHRVRLLVVKSTEAVFAGKENRFSSTWSPEMADEGGSHSPQRSTWRPSHQHSFQNQKWKASWPWWVLSPSTVTHTQEKGAQRTLHRIWMVFTASSCHTSPLAEHTGGWRWTLAPRRARCRQTDRAETEETHIKSKCISQLLQPHLQGLLHEELREIQKQAPKPLCQACILLLCTSVQLLIVCFHSEGKTPNNKTPQVWISGLAWDFCIFTCKGYSQQQFAPCPS